jgi:hypothetical protein
MNPALYTVLATVTAAFIAGLVAFLTSMLSKELKTSEFRYSWLNAVLDDTAKFLGVAQSLSVSRSASPNETAEEGGETRTKAEAELGEAMAAYYRARIRLYPDKHASAIAAIDALQSLLVRGGTVDRPQLDSRLREVVETTHQALKDEWGKVKRGEFVFRLTKYVSLAAMALTLALPFGFYFLSR